MSEIGTDESACIKPISFHVISEDGYANDFNHEPQEERAPTFEAHHQTTKANRRQPSKQPNFSFEYSYPAVIFDKICFSINKSQQQANFLNECLKKLSSCIPSNSSKDQKVDILKSINLNVPYGSIFGLLGPSSCGKTTLLRCLVGLLEPTAGSIRLFSHSPLVFDEDVHDECCGMKSRPKRPSDCKIPGPNVGYMPQDLGLYEDFSIRQLLTMFGQYVGMNSKLIVTRIDFMAKFLDLPEVDRQICSLSGGQKRRVSFAIACLHMPPLIILDEPTVGVDPLLRKSIWKYLRQLADEEKKTIIITTHYIEEAAQADQVALMRAGEILVQDTPSRIMKSNRCKSLEEAFLKICNNIQASSFHAEIPRQTLLQHTKIYPQTKFNWHNKLKGNELVVEAANLSPDMLIDNKLERGAETKEEEINLQTSKLMLLDGLRLATSKTAPCDQHNTKLDYKINKLSMEPNIVDKTSLDLIDGGNEKLWKEQEISIGKINQENKLRSLKGTKLRTTHKKYGLNNCDDDNSEKDDKLTSKSPGGTFCKKLHRTLVVMWALFYKNYRRNVNSLPLLAFQFMLPIIQMISFSLCVGGRPTNIGLGLVNLDQQVELMPSNALLTSLASNSSTDLASNDYDGVVGSYSEELLSHKYLSFIDGTMLSIKNYDNIKDALNDVRKAKLWAAMEIGENFTTSILKRFDLENFYQLDLDTIHQSVIKLYPDRSNKVLDMICHKSLINSYRKFLVDQFEHFKSLPIEVRWPVYDIKPNLISNSIDGYTESIAAGLLASLTYIMAAGLTTFIMVVERSAGILERTYTSGISPLAYLLAHAVFRSTVMMLQVAVVMILTFYILQQPLVGSGWLAYLMLMTLNLTGIAYGLLVSSLVTDQNGAALAIVSSLVVKITLSGILWPLEAIPRWLRNICYIQPLTMPVQALKTITLKGNGLEDRTVYLGLVVSLAWLAIFLTISAKRFKFYQH